VSGDNGDKPWPVIALAWPLLWFIGWAADKIYENLTLDIDWEDEAF